MRVSAVAHRVLCGYLLSLLTISALGQSPDANINGSVQDPSTGAIVGAEIVAVNDVTGVQYTTRSNSEGIFVLPNLPPGPYRVQVSKVGFKTIIKPDLALNVQDALSLNFTLPIGAAYEVVTVEGGALLLNTDNATVSTVVDRQFAENLPMNGRSFQTLIQLTPGTVTAPTNPGDGGQFSVNGQRPASNYWMVDGVSANVGIGTSAAPGNGLGGTLGAFSTMGGTNSLVSVDAMQEFRIQTSTFAPEFGRTPGAQISIVTRSGTNQFHGTAFDYLRNDALDANNWFNGFNENPPLPKAEERQNDFGGTFSGPILKDRTFFFLSYEGLRLRLPQTTLSNVPDLAARHNAVPAMQPFLNAFPLPNGTDNPGTGQAVFNSSYSNPATLDAVSLRIDHRVADRWNLFARYNYSPSKVTARGGNGGGVLSEVQANQIRIQTVTLGATWAISSIATNELRFNYSRTSAQGASESDNFGGAAPIAALPFPTSYTRQNSLLDIDVFGLGASAELAVGKLARNVQRQWNLVDGFSLQEGRHHFKFGVDFRRLSPIYDPLTYSQLAVFSDIPSFESGSSVFSEISTQNGVTLLFTNLGLYAQDSWHGLPRLTLTYGLRWDLDSAPSTLNGPPIPAVTGYSLVNLSQLAVAAPGTPVFTTTYHNFAPRFGFAYEISRKKDWQTVFRAGSGIFFDLVSSEAGNVLGQLSVSPPFGNFRDLGAAQFPFTSAQSAPVPIPPTGTLSNFAAFNPILKLPYTLEWNAAIEQALGKDQTISTSYVAARGKRLLQTTQFSTPATNPNIGFANLVDNTSFSYYDALQIEFRRRLSHGFQSLASYTWSHSIDNGSAGSASLNSNLGVPGNASRSRGASDFDIRNAFTAGFTYDIPSLSKRQIAMVFLRGWSTDNFILARTAPPVDVADANFSVIDGNSIDVRPDLVIGQPIFLRGAVYPGGKALNPSAFADPPLDPNTGNPLRQGDTPRNYFRGFGAIQWDFAIHRQIPLRERLKLEFRAELFNVLNHANFGPPNNEFGGTGFGLATQLLGQSLAGRSLGSGGFSPLYQVGGPRSIQLALKLIL